MPIYIKEKSVFVSYEGTFYSDCLTQIDIEESVYTQLCSMGLCRVQCDVMVMGAGQVGQAMGAASPVGRCQTGIKGLRL